MHPRFKSMISLITKSYNYYYNEHSEYIQDKEEITFTCTDHMNQYTGAWNSSS